MLAFTAAHASASPAEELFATSFEADEQSPYLVGKLVDHEGWVLNGSGYKSAALVVAGGADDAPAAPDGKQMIRIENPQTIFDNGTGGPFVSYQFSGKPLKEALHFSGLTAFTGSITPETEVISRFYLTNASKKESFLGAAFGIWQKRGELKFFYTTGSRGRMTSLGEAMIEPGKFYRFEVNVNPEQRSFGIRVYDHGSGTLLASAEDGRFRGDVDVLINYLRMSNSSNTPTRGDKFAVYYDDIRIGKGTLPEP